MKREDVYDMDDYKTYIVDKASRRLLYKSNDKDECFCAILVDFYEKACGILRDWRHLQDDKEFLNGQWDEYIVDFVVNSYKAMGDEIVYSESVNGISRTYRINPVAELKKAVPQKCR